MQDKDKLFLVVYFGVEGANSFYSNQVMAGFYEKLKSTLDDTIKVYVVPQRSTKEIKMELLNIENCSEEKLSNIEKIYQEILNEIKKSV